MHGLAYLALQPTGKAPIQEATPITIPAGENETWSCYKPAPACAGTAPPFHSDPAARFLVKIMATAIPQETTRAKPNGQTNNSLGGRNHFVSTAAGSRLSNSS